MTATAKNRLAELSNSSHRFDCHEYDVTHTDGSVSRVRLSLVPGYSGVDHLFDRTLAEAESVLAGRLAPASFKRPKQLSDWLYKVYSPWKNGRPEWEVVAFKCGHNADVVAAKKRKDAICFLKKLKPCQRSNGEWVLTPGGIPNRYETGVGFNDTGFFFGSNQGYATAADAVAALKKHIAAMSL